jgi:hypothetical protein
MSNARQNASHNRIEPTTMPRLGTVDEGFQSYNVEMVEVIGGRFWKPYSKEVDAILSAQSSARQPNTASDPVGMDPSLYQQRPPLDLSTPRLRKLAAALGPAYVRVSGTWANTVYFHDADSPRPAPPAGFGGVLTREQWQGVVNFSQAVDAQIVTSFATGVGTRNAAGVWTPDQARRFLAYTQSVGGSIVAAEFMNEPTFAEMGGAPTGYDAAAYGRDLAVFASFIKQAAPDMLLLGPGSVGEGATQGLSALPMKIIATEDMLKATGPIYDVFSYHFYGAVSKRCAGTMPQMATTEEMALSEEWFSQTETVEAFYEALRDRFEPGKPIWLTETADAACGGNPWGSTFLDSFRYLEQLGRLAQRGVQVVMHNTFASSDYGMLDESTLAPRPNYWAALLWRKLMGTTVFAAGDAPAAGLNLYAHSLRDHPSGMALLVINSDRAASQELEIPVQSDRYTLTARELTSSSVQLNGRNLELRAEDALPSLQGEPTPPGKLLFAPASITFLALTDAKNSSSR